MSSSENNTGLMSNAGLVRYFDSEDQNAFQIDPKTVLAAGAVSGVGVMLLHALI